MKLQLIAFTGSLKIIIIIVGVIVLLLPLVVHFIFLIRAIPTHLDQVIGTLAGSHGCKCAARRASDSSSIVSVLLMQPTGRRAQATAVEAAVVAARTGRRKE